jgi:predicted nucleic acid-binding Zn ribbon protein
VGLLVIMDLDGQIKLGHLLLQDRKCRTCGDIKNLVESFYRTRKDRGPVASSYSYECKECTIQRIVTSKMTSNIFDRWEYPDW